jgi:hypothetical protein
VTGPSTGKPTVAELGIDLAAQLWHGSGSAAGAIEVAFARAAKADPAKADPAKADPAKADPAAADRPDPAGRAEWVLMRVTDDPEQRVLVFDRHEWECFLDGARKGEFDDAAASQ